MRRLWGVIALALLGSVLFAPASSAQEDDSGAAVEFLQIHGIDSRNPSAVQMVVGWTGSASALEQATITENSEEVSVGSVEPAPEQRGVLVLAVDTSQAMTSGDALTRSKRALIELVESRPDGQRIGVVSFGGGTARVVHRPTTNKGRLVDAIDNLAVVGDAGTWAGIDTAARSIIAEGSPGQHSQIVILSAGRPVSSEIGPQRARGSLVSSGASTWVVALEDRGSPHDYLRDLTLTTGGRYFGTVNVDAVASSLDEIGRLLDSRYVVTYQSGQSGPVDITLAVGDETVGASYISGSNLAGGVAIAPVDGTEPGGIEFLRQNGRIIGIVLAVVAAVLAIYAIGSLMAPDRSGLDHALEVYVEGPDGSTADDDDGSGLARTALIQRAVGITEGIAERQGFLGKAEALLERADLPLRAAEALFFYATSVVLLVVLAFFLTDGNLLGTLVASGIIAVLPFAVVSFLARRRQKAFTALLPDTLQLLAGTLRAGYSLMQGVEAVSRESSEPMGKELRRVVTEARLGRPLEESLEASADRMESPDFAWAVMAIKIQREVGGNLAELLMTVADTMTQRERLRRDVSSLTAEGRISAIVLGLLPVGLGLAIWTMSPEYINVLFEHSTGQFLLGGAIILAGFGFYWMKKVIDVDI